MPILLESETYNKTMLRLIQNMLGAKVLEESIFWGIDYFLAKWHATLKVKRTNKNISDIKYYLKKHFIS